MKKLLLIFALAFATSTNAQNPCDSIPPLMQIGYSTGSHTFCVPGTYNVNQSTSGWVRITPQYVDTTTCSFAVNGGAPTVTASITFTPSVAGVTSFTLIGVNPAYPACTQTVVFSFTTVACQYTYTGPATGIEEYEQYEAITPVYYDVYGNRIDKRYNEMIIDRRGRYVRKVVFQQ